MIITGSVNRSYNVVSQDATVSVKNVNYKVNDLAEKYTPQVSIEPSIDVSSLYKIYYEIIDKGKQVTINYYYTWNGENDPNTLIDIASKIWKFVYFRFVLSDVEFIQLTVDKSSGEISSSKTKNDFIRIMGSSPCFLVGSWNHDFTTKILSGCQSGHKNTPLVYFKNSDYSHLKMARRDQGDFKTEDNMMNFPFIIFLALLATYYFRHIQKDYNNEYHIG